MRTKHQLDPVLRARYDALIHAQHVLIFALEQGFSDAVPRALSAIDPLIASTLCEHCEGRCCDECETDVPASEVAYPENG
jgi:hypothetical protein